MGRNREASPICGHGEKESCQLQKSSIKVIAWPLIPASHQSEEGQDKAKPSGQN